MTYSGHKRCLIALVVLLFTTSALRATPLLPDVQVDSSEQFSDAVRYFNSAQYSKALALFNDLAPPDSAAALSYYRGACLYQLGNYKAGLASLAAVDSSDSLYPLTCFYTAEIMLALHNPAEAVRCLQITVTRDSTYNPARVELVNALCILRRFADAEEFVEEHFDERETIALCEGMLDAGKYQDAYPYISKVLAHDSTNAAAQLMLAEAYYNANKYSDAAKVYSLMLGTFGPSPFVVKRLALCHGKMKGRANFETAISLMNRYLALSQDTTSEDIGSIGLWYYDIGDYRSAEGYFRTAVKMDTIDPQARLNLGLALMQLDRPREAIRSMRLAYVLSKSTLSFSLSILKSIAAAEIRVEEYRGAISSYRRVLEMDPEDGEALYGLGLAYDQSHHVKEAVFWYRRFLRSGRVTDKAFTRYARNRLSELAARK